MNRHAQVVLKQSVVFTIFYGVVMGVALSLPIWLAIVTALVGGVLFFGLMYAWGPANPRLDRQFEGKGHFRRVGSRRP